MADVIDAGNKLLKAVTGALQIGSGSALLTAVVVGVAVFALTNMWKVALVIGLVQLVVQRCSQCSSAASPSSKPSPAAASPSPSPSPSPAPK